MSRDAPLQKAPREALLKATSAAIFAELSELGVTDGWLQRKGASPGESPHGLSQRRQITVNRSPHRPRRRSRSSSMDGSSWLAAASRVGNCFTTAPDDEGDCEIGVQGSFVKSRLLFINRDRRQRVPAALPGV